MPPNHPNRSKHSSNPAGNPAPADIRAAREAAGLTQSQAAGLVYVTLRAWQQYETETAADARAMHPATWELFQLKSQAVSALKLELAAGNSVDVSKDAGAVAKYIRAAIRRDSR